MRRATPRKRTSPPHRTKTPRGQVARHARLATPGPRRPNALRKRASPPGQQTPTDAVSARPDTCSRLSARTQGPHAVSATAASLRLSPARPCPTHTQSP
ncbi:hypothetical protein B0H17DRAFT_429489 [Mycena rosella]|uniref:Uncharacterized protein n=1 Tax=Mycena rosella TaxID=1033263 RepID=A0AAD7G1D3_MYCRO|nr:hypothetical protein B0H17DRAFT_429489 [Mycena rosella]